MIEDIRYSKPNWALVLVAVLLMLLMFWYFDRAVAQDRDPKATSLAQKTWDAMGGMEAWKQVAALRFNFQVEPQGQPPRAVKHLWDRSKGVDHIEGKTRDGKQMVAWVRLKDKTGVAWSDGKKLEGDQLKEAMAWAYQRWVNDTYWLIMPFKLMDSGVNLKYEGAKDKHDVLHLSFGNVGLTPGDQYWAYINKDTGLMDRWEYLLEGEKEKGTWDWVDWENFGKLKLSKKKTTPDKKTAIHFTPLKIIDSADSSYFTDDLKLLND
jgi:hypothetical protein